MQVSRDWRVNKMAASATLHKHTLFCLEIQVQKTVLVLVKHTVQTGLGPQMMQFKSNTEIREFRVRKIPEA